MDLPAVATMIGSVAPYVVPIALVCVGAGVVWKNREEIKAVCTSIHQKMISAGVNFALDSANNYIIDLKSKQFIESELNKKTFDLSISNGGSFSIPVGKEAIKWVCPEGMRVNLNWLSNYRDYDGLLRKDSKGLQGGYYVYISKTFDIRFISDRGWYYDSTIAYEKPFVTFTIETGKSVCFDFNPTINQNVSISNDKVLDSTFQGQTADKAIDSVIGLTDVNNYPFVKDNVDKPIDNNENPAVSNKIVDALKSLSSIKKVYSRTNGELDIEIEGSGRVKIKESSITDQLKGNDTALKLWEEFIQRITDENSEKKTDEKSDEAVDKLENIEDDILDTMEDSGGHTLDRHIGKSKEYLIDRAKNIMAKGATTYTDKVIAVKSVKDVLSKNSHEIVEWLNKTKDARKIIETEHSFDVGNGVLKNTDKLVEGLKKTITVLERAKDTDLGFRIITSYPVIN